MTRVISRWLAASLMISLAGFSGNTATAQTTNPPIVSLAFAPDGKQVLTTSQLGVQVLSWPDLRVVKTVESESPNVRCIAFSPNAKVIAIGGGTPSSEGAIELLSWPQLLPIKTLRRHSDSVTDVVWLDDRSIASSSLDHRVIHWNTETGKPDRVFQGHSRGVMSLSWIASKKTLVSTGIDQSLRVWNTETAKLIRSLSIHIQPINDLAQRPMNDGFPMVASASDDRTVRFWQPTIGRMVRFARLPAKPLAIAWTNDGRHLLAACSDGKLRIVDPDTVEVVGTKDALQGWAHCLAVHPSEDSVIVGGARGQTVLIERIRPPRTRIE